MRKGFTLIELLVVIAIIGGLAALLVPNFMGARQRGRDAQRKSDLKQIQKAMELYKLDQADSSYPPTMPTVNNQWLAASGNIYMNKVPADPSTKLKYYYVYNAVNTTYVLQACLENNADSDANIVDCQSNFDVITGGSACTSKTTSRPNGTCYEVIQP